MTAIGATTIHKAVRVWLYRADDPTTTDWPIVRNVSGQETNTMQLPLQLTFRDIPPSDAIAAYVRTKAAKLDTFFDRITSCRVAVEAPHRHHRHGKQYRVRVDMTVPGDELVAGCTASEDPKTQDVYALIDNVFEEAGRQLQEYARKRRHETKHHGAEHRFGNVAKVFNYEGYGFIETSENYDVYFHQNSVLNGGFAKLKPGMTVRFVEELGDKGPQASTVEVVRAD